MTTGGSALEPVFLTLDEVLEIHEQQIERYGGSHGLSDAGDWNLRLQLLRQPSAANSCILRFPLWRVGANAAITFLVMNDWKPTFDEEELIELVLSVASSRLGKTELVAMFERRCRLLEIEATF